MGKTSFLSAALCALVACAPESSNVGANPSATNNSHASAGAGAAGTGGLAQAGAAGLFEASSGGAAGAAESGGVAGNAGPAPPSNAGQAGAGVENAAGQAQAGAGQAQAGAAGQAQAGAAGLPESSSGGAAGSAGSAGANPTATCGNNACEAGEDKCSCPADCGQPQCGECGQPACGPVCGNNACEAGEDKCSCPSDCGAPGCGECGQPACGPVCGNSVCEAGETKCSCSQDCGPYGATSSPPQGTWTGGLLNTACTCSDPTCHSLYDWRVVGFSSGPNGPRATVEVRKVDGTSIGAGRAWWVVVMAETDKPTCSNLDIFQVRASGTFGSTQSAQIVTFDVWPSVSDPEATKTFALITDGSDGPGIKRWFSSNTIHLTRNCAD